MTKKEIAPQLKKSSRNLAGHAEKLRRGRSTIAVGGKTGGRDSDPLVLGFEGSLGGEVRALVRTPVEVRQWPCHTWISQVENPTLCPSKKCWNTLWNKGKSNVRLRAVKS